MNETKIQPLDGRRNFLFENENLREPIGGV